jgi:MFS family permease
VNAALLRLIGAQISIHACMTGMRMATPLLALREGYSAAAVGFLLALFALTQVFLSLPAGRYADRHGLKRPLALSVSAAMLGAGAAAAFPLYPVLCAAALLTGGASGAAIIALQRHVGRSAHDKTQLRKVFSWLAIGPAVSNFLGPFAAGLLIDYAGGQAASTTGFRAAFVLLALLPLAAWLLSRTVQETPQDAAPTAAKQATAWDLFQNRGFRRLLLMNWALSSCWDVHTFVVPILGHERGLSASVIGTILGAFAIAAAAIRLLVPLLSERIREWQVVFTAMVLAALLFMLYPLMPGAWSMGACSVLLGLVLGSVQPMVMSMIHQITPPHRHGEALGLRMMAINGSSVVMPMLFGTLGTVVGVSALFWAVGAVVGGSARLPWLIGRDDLP